MTRIKVNVTFQSGVGYVSEANPGVTRSLSALSLEGLRKRIMVVALQRRRDGEEVALTLLLDSAAQRRRWPNSGRNRAKWSNWVVQISAGGAASR